jgi:hypothetical protein
LFDDGPVFHCSPHKWYVKILADLAHHLINDLAVARHLRLAIISLEDAMPSAFSDQDCSVGLQVLDELCSSHDCPTLGGS